MAKYKEEILRLRAEGKSYREIQAELGCSKGTISYHLGDGQKEKTYQKTVERRKQAAAYKVDIFNRKREEPKVSYGSFVDNPKSVIKDKVSRFQDRAGSEEEGRFNVKDFIERFGEVDECYLTGRPIDINNPRTYQLDHIVPKSKGGSNSIDNCGITTREANNAKGYQSLEEFLLLCYDVLVHWEVIEEEK